MSKDYLTEMFGEDKDSKRLRLSREELWPLFKEMGFTIGCEVGVARAYNVETICRCIPNLRIYLVDPYYKDRAGRHVTPKQYRWARRRMRKCRKFYGTNYTFIKKLSHEAVKDFEDGMLDFVYIDADHNYEQVIRDVTEWSKKVRVGGVVSGHDYYNGCRGVIKAVDKYRKAHKIKTLYITAKDKRRSWFWVKP